MAWMGPGPAGAAALAGTGAGWQAHGSMSLLLGPRLHLPATTDTGHGRTTRTTGIQGQGNVTKGASCKCSVGVVAGAAPSMGSIMPLLIIMPKT